MTSAKVSPSSSNFRMVGVSSSTREMVLGVQAAATHVWQPTDISW
jgi:hypothetical protein